MQEVAQVVKAHAAAKTQHMLEVLPNPSYTNTKPLTTIYRELLTNAAGVRLPLQAILGRRSPPQPLATKPQTPNNYPQTPNPQQLSPENAPRLEAMAGGIVLELTQHAAFYAKNGAAFEGGGGG